MKTLSRDDHLKYIDVEGMKVVKNNRCVESLSDVTGGNALSLSLFLCSIVHRLDTVALLHTCFPCFQTFQTHMTILPTHSRWLKVCQKTELHLTW